MKIINEEIMEDERTALEAYFKTRNLTPLEVCVLCDDALKYSKYLTKDLIKN